MSKKTVDGRWGKLEIEKMNLELLESAQGESSKSGMNDEGTNFTSQP